jgi:hypothetical protein
MLGMKFHGGSLRKTHRVIRQTFHAIANFGHEEHMKVLDIYALEQRECVL